MPQRSLLYDRPDSFGWMSIGFHWASAIIIILLWFIGKSIEFQPEDAVEARRILHVTIGLMAWLPLMVRILWRVISKHPQARGQTRLAHTLARYAHNLMLLMLAVMLISGPVTAATLSGNSEMARTALLIHASTAGLLMVMILLHIAAALKHLMFSDDDTIARIFVPRKSAD